MPHKADRSFFDAKREWSKRKDLILRNYLTPYLAKVAKLRRPILLVDGFAGAGRYRSGEEGSPVIIATAAQEALARSEVPISVLCIEQDDELRARLVEALAPFPFASTRPGTFSERIDEIEQLAESCTTFLYVDPYAIEGLEWQVMEKVFKHVQANKSVEILLNFSAASFVRRALAAMSLAAPSDPGGDDDGSAEPPSIEPLNDAVGGDWWQQIIADRRRTFAEQVSAVSSGYCKQLRAHFREVCEHPIRARWNDAVPKYSLIFASRSPDALVLMNDATIKSRDLLAGQARPSQDTLFETRPIDLVPDLGQLPQIAWTAARTRMTRRDLVAKVVRQHFCQFKESQIKGAITDLIKARRLTSATGKSRINDLVEVWQA